MLKRIALCLPLLATHTRAEPNIVLVVGDDQRPDTIHALGNANISTPALDALANGGFVFTRALNQGGFNAAVCVPARAMLHSGQHLWRIDENLTGCTSLGAALRAAGYHTHATGKWHNGDPSLLAAFETASQVTGGHLSTGNTANFTLKSVANGAVATTSNTTGAWAADLTGQAAVDFVADYRENRPFFLYVAFNSPHDPREAPAAWLARYHDARNQPTPPLPTDFLTQHPFDNGEMSVRDETLLPKPLDPAAVREELAKYYAMISQMDDWIGRLRNTLSARGFADNTLFVFTADQGLALGSHGLLGKQNLYEHSLRVPLVFSGPGVPVARSGVTTFQQDLFATLLDYAGVPPPAGQRDGVSLKPVIEGGVAIPRAVSYHGYRSVQRAVRQSRWKLIEYNAGSVRNTQLFDLWSDPDERTNLAGLPGHANIVAGMRAALLEQRTAHSDNDPEFWNNSGLLPPLPSVKVVASGQTPNQPNWLTAGWGGGAQMFFRGSLASGTNGPFTSPSNHTRAGPFAAWLGDPAAAASSNISIQACNFQTAIQAPSGSGTIAPGVAARIALTDDTVQDIVGIPLSADVPPMLRVGVLVNNARIYTSGSEAPPVLRLSHGGVSATHTVNRPANIQADWYFFDIDNATAGQALVLGGQRASPVSPLRFAAVGGLVVLNRGGTGTAADADGDGMDDSWESERFTPLAPEAVAPGDDPDHDGFRNLDEYCFDTDPRDPFSRPALRVSLDGPDLLLGWKGSTRRRYVIQHSTDLHTWLPVTGPLTGLGIDAEIPLPLPTGAAHGFRLAATGE